MSNTKNYTRLQQVKTSLAEKYEHLASVTNSKPKRQTFKYKAERYRRQAEQAGKLA